LLHPFLYVIDFKRALSFGEAQPDPSYNRGSRPEGVSLHRANVVLNYDIPWNPTRLIQRVGRVNRVDTAHTHIHTFHFFPTEQGNDLIKLQEAAEAKIQGFIEMLGADAQLLTEGEEIIRKKHANG
jgi:superfamily II DNA/RNA helicase